VNGQIDIDGVAGDIAASTVNGETRIKDASSNLKLNTVNGSITAEMNSLGNGQNVSLDAVNGELDLSLPEDTDAKFSVTTVNGEISSEFPSLQARHEFPVGNNLKGRLGNGAGSVKVSTVNGTVNFLKRAPATNAVPSAANAGQNETVAVAAAQKWLSVMDAGNYSESWKEASEIFQKGITQTNWNNLISTYRQPLGSLVSRKLLSSQAMTELPGAPDGQYVVMQFDTSFANKTATVETVTFDLEKDGQWKSSGYFIK
jgi:hypothetical protein